MQPTPGLVAILAYDGLCTFEFGIAVEVFGLTRPEFDFPWYSHAIAAVDQGPMRAMGGIFWWRMRRGHWMRSAAMCRRLR